MINIDYVFNEHDPSILHVVHRAHTTWKDALAKIDVIRQIPKETLPVIHLIVQLEDSGIVQDSMVGRFSTFAELFENPRIGLRVFVHHGFEIAVLISFFLRSHPEYKNRLFVTPTVEAAYALLQREKAKQGY